MKKIIPILLLFSWGILLYGQEKAMMNEIDTVAYYMQSFQYQKALDYIDRKTPDKTFLLQKAKCYKALGNCNNSIAILLPLSEEYPADMQIESELASCYQLTGNWQTGAACYDRLIQMDSANIYFHIQKADMVYHQEKFGEALSLYKSIAIGHGTPNILKRIGRCYESMNVVDSAQSYYLKAWNIDPNDNAAASNYINTSLKLKEYMTALEACTIYTERDSTDKQINRLHALTYYIMDLYEPASELFEKCFANGDSSLIVNRALGISYYSLKDSRAYEFLKRAYSQDTLNNNVLYSLGVVCNDLSKEEEAVKYFTTLLERIIPKSGSLYLNYRGLAIAYDNLGKYTEAVESYNQAIKYANESQRAYVLAIISGIYDDHLNDKKMARKYYKEYREALALYLDRMKAKEDADPNDIKDVKMRLKDLDIYIKSMEKELFDIGKTDSIADNSKPGRE